ncbi:Nucleoside 2-deoxyribosyltransferase [compost metagenome]
MQQAFMLQAPKRGRLARVPTVYLAGGMRTNWQDEVIKRVKGAIFLDPRNHGASDEDGYTAWDLAAVERSDIIFGFIEKTNPCGAGLAVEFGMAYGMGKRVLYIEEPDFPHSRYFGMVRAIARAQGLPVHSVLGHGIQALNQLIADGDF